MEKKCIVKGQTIPVPGNDIDTDRIIPARFMKCVSFNGLGEFAFYDARFTEEGEKKEHSFNDKRFSSGSILVVNKNFGCGSSREHAPQALARYGIKALIGESFAEIFRGNCTTMGIPTVTLPEQNVMEIMAEIEKDPGLEVTINLVDGITETSKGKYQHHIPESFRNALTEGLWDSTSLLKENIEDIEVLEKKLPYRF